MRHLRPYQLEYALQYSFIINFVCFSLHTHVPCFIAILNMLDTSKASPSTWPRSHYDLIEHHYARYDSQIALGEYQPFLYPWGTLGLLALIIYLCIPHHNRPWLKKARFLVFAWTAGFAAYTILFTRARGMAPAMGIGLISAWSVAWVFAIIICNDAQTDFQRIERSEGFFKKSSKAREGQYQNGNANGPPTNDMIKGHAGPSNRHGEFAWQPYPLTPFIERLDWVLDILTTFRGAGWNWRPSILPPPPKPIQHQLLQNTTPTPPPKTSFRTHPNQATLYPTRTALLHANFKTLITGYLTLDLLKTTMMHDPYFWGLTTHSPPPPSFLPRVLTPYFPTLLHTYRLTLCMLGVKSALQTIFSLGPLIFSGLLGPSLLGARAAPWMYPETWGPFSAVLDRGLAGWWSVWWHQTFRFAFEEPGRRLVESLGWRRGDVRARAVQLGVAFGMSGFVHACGAWTCAGQTDPLRGSLVFFLLQAGGIFVEGCVRLGLGKTGVQGYVPTAVKRVVTFVYVHVWFYYTAHLLGDDFSRGGVWLFEPVPVSLFRGLGFGADGRDGWWCWSGQPVRWHSGGTWWTSGFAL